MSALPRPEVPPGPHRDLVDTLHDLHHRAGWPSLRRLAIAAGCSHTTVSKAFSSTALPTWGTLELLVEAMDGDTTSFHDLWLAASSPAAAHPAPPATRIAGRRTELAAVRDHLQTGTGLLLVTGEAGIGKTALVTAAARSADTWIATGHCRPLSTLVPLLPIGELLRQLLEDSEGFSMALEVVPSLRRGRVGAAVARDRPAALGRADPGGRPAAAVQRDPYLPQGPHRDEAPGNPHRGPAVVRLGHARPPRDDGRPGGRRARRRDVAHGRPGHALRSRVVALAHRPAVEHRDAGATVRRGHRHPARAAGRAPTRHPGDRTHLPTQPWASSLHRAARSGRQRRRERAGRPCRPSQPAALGAR